jgi:hypothetical protein
MRISSLSTPFVEPSSKPGHSGDSSGPVLGIFRKLDRMLTAMACAEAGDLDAVKDILGQDTKRKKR